MKTKIARRLCSSESERDREEKVIKVSGLFFLFFLLMAIAANAEGQTEKYVIGDEDVLRISVWGNQELTAEIPVRPDGMISVPLIGDVKVSGIAPEELKKFLEKEYANFVKSPTVSVIVTQINSFKVYVLGEGVSAGASTGSGGGAASAGVITLRKNTSLIQLLAQLGSFRGADLSSAYVLRDGKRLGNDLYRLVYKGDNSQDIQLRPNDVLFIPDNFDKRIMVVGAVKTPIVLPYREGLTALDAILSAGGFTEFASQNSVVVLRKEGAEIKNVEVRMKDVIAGDVGKNIALKPGDVVTVKTGLF